MEIRFEENQIDIINALSEIIVSECLLKIVSNTYNFKTNYELKDRVDIF